MFVPVSGTCTGTAIVHKAYVDINCRLSGENRDPRHSTHSTHRKGRRKKRGEQTRNGWWLGPSVARTMVVQLVPTHVPAIIAVVHVGHMDGLSIRVHTSDRCTPNKRYVLEAILNIDLILLLPSAHKELDNVGICVW